MTLTPNTQITQENVELLKAGDVLRDDYAQLFTFASLLASDTVSIQRYQGDDPTRFMVSPVSSLTYIGPDLGDGWIGWGGGKPPVDKKMLVDVRLQNGDELFGAPASDWYWGKYSTLKVIAFRPPTPAPSADHIADAGKMGAVDWQVVGPKLVEALEKIERWHGEFPPTGKFLPRENGEPDLDHPTSYVAEYGSNGERDFMRSVARAALAAATPGGK